VVHTGQLHPASWPTGTANPKQVAVDDLREGLLKLVKEFGAPQELTLTLPTAACDSLAGPDRGSGECGPIFKAVHAISFNSGRVVVTGAVVRRTLTCVVIAAHWRQTYFATLTASRSFWRRCWPGCWSHGYCWRGGGTGNYTGTRSW
jgi:hypothetical protein